MTKKKVHFTDKIRSSYYLDPKTEERLVQVYIKRMKEGERSRKSGLIDEAVKLLYEHEFKK